jgi:hypothetical protein
MANPVPKNFAKAINLKDRTPEDRHRIAVMGGSSRSIKKSQAQILRRLRDGKGISDVSIQKLATNPEYSAVHLLNMAADILRNEKLSARDKIALLQVQINLHEKIHGSKQRIESKNVNVNINFSAEVDKIIKEADDGKEEVIKEDTKKEA